MPTVNLATILIDRFDREECLGRRKKLDLWAPQEVLYWAPCPLEAMIINSFTLVRHCASSLALVCLLACAGQSQKDA